VSGAKNPIQIGLGTNVTEIVAKHEQGSIQTTGIKTQLAIQGEGFFQINVNGNDHYTRAGNFGFNQEGYLVHGNNGGIVRGFVGTKADGTLDTSAGLQDIQIDLGQASAPNATSLVRFITNLSAEAATDDTYAASIEVFDSKGVAHQLSLTFTKTSTDGLWDYNFTFDDGTVNTMTAPTQGVGSLQFDPSGNLLEVDGTPISGLTPPSRSFEISGLNTGADDMLIEMDFINYDLDDPTNNSGLITNYGNKNSTGTLFQNGYGSGVLQDIDFDQEGTMIGFFDNGLTLELARVGLATFNNRNGLKQVDGGFFLPTAASGPASVDGEGTGGRGSIISSSLEASNVDIAEEFTALILYQRGYQSNSRTITTTDQLLNEALNLKR
jgi:flagellar hook protein FlgE